MRKRERKGRRYLLDQMELKVNANLSLVVDRGKKRKKKIFKKERKNCRNKREREKENSFL